MSVRSMMERNRLGQSLGVPASWPSAEPQPWQSNHPSLRRNCDVRELASESSSDNQIIVASQTFRLHCHAGIFLPVNIDLQCSPVVSGSRGNPSSQWQFCWTHVSRMLISRYCLQLEIVGYEHPVRTAIPITFFHNIGSEHGRKAELGLRPTS